MNTEKKNNKVSKVTLGKFCEENIVWIDYEDGTYKAIFID